VRKGDRVGIWAPNRFEWVIIQFATARIGAVLVNINPAYQLSELGYALAQSGVSFSRDGPRVPAIRLRRPSLNKSGHSVRNCAKVLCSSGTGICSSRAAAQVSEAALAECERCAPI
jgi:acyl-coenzyme A synthetase/AMP-(fatty) acid ligase